MSAREKLRPIARRALAAQSDERLVRLIREGHLPAFEEAVRRYQGPLVAFAAAIVPYDRAEDVVQASLQKAHAALRADEREINLRPWLFAIVRNGALNVIRDDPSWETIDPNLAGARQPSAVAEQNEDLKRLVTAICALPAAQRQALVRREIEGDGHAEIAAALGTSATAVRGLIFRARSALRDGLGALVPLPVLRLLMTEAPAVAGGGVAVGGLALGAGAKTGVVLTTAALALGGGLVAERDRSGERVAEASPPVERADPNGSGTGAGRSEAAGLDAAVPRAGGGGDSGPAERSGPGGGGGDESGGEGRSHEGEGSDDPVGDDGDRDEGSGSDDGDSGSSGDDGSDDSDSGSDSDSGDEPEIEEDHSGPGGGDSGDEAPAIEEDHSGSGGGGDGLEALEDDLVDPVAEPDTESSGSGSGGSDDPLDLDD